MQITANEAHWCRLETRNVSGCNNFGVVSYKYLHYFQCGQYFAQQKIVTHTVTEFRRRWGSETVTLLLLGAAINVQIKPGFFPLSENYFYLEMVILSTR